MPALDYVLTIRYLPGDSATEDRVQAVLFLSSCLGSTIDERDGRTVVECYFESSGDRDAAAEMLHSLNVVLVATERARVDWLQLYRQSLRPIEVGRRLVVVPDASIPTAADRIRIVIPQERAFGTGSHESTALCLELLEELDLRDARGLDVGTGSGILAVAMVKLGARKVIAFDVDFETFGILPRNLVRNGISQQQIAQFFGELSALRPTRFEVMTMNIIPEVIEPQLGKVRDFLGGSLIVSGITLDRRHGVIARAAAVGLAPRREKTSNDWWAAELRLS